MGDESGSPEHSGGWKLPVRLTSFVGREAEVELLRTRLGRHRLVTVVGSGGTGKTSVAIEAARSLTSRFEDGVYLAELAKVEKADLVGQAVATALGIPEHQGLSMAEAVAAAAGRRHLLLVLDNCEHVLGSAADLCVALLMAGEDLRVLATSREPLDVDGEQVVRLDPLQTPAGTTGTMSPEEAAGCDSVKLFVDRASSHRADFVLDDSNVGSVVAICQQLEGLPLAIELAAARLRSMSTSEIEANLADRFRFLTSGHRTAMPRHRTLRALIDWSWELLGSDEQVLLRRLSQFAGGWRMEAAERVCADTTLGAENVADCLAALVSKSLVEMTPSGDVTRYRLLETIREYAAERLVESGEADLMARAHAEEYLSLVEEAESHLRDRSQREWLARLDEEADNIRVAAASMLTSAEGTGPALRLVGAMRGYWEIRGRYREGSELTEAALRLGDSAQTPRLWCRAQITLLWLRLSTGELATATGRIEQGLSIARAQNDDASVAEFLQFKIWHGFTQGDPIPRVNAMVREAIEVARRTGDRHLIGRILGLAGTCVQAESGANVDDAAANVSEAVEIFRECGDVHWLGHALNNLASMQMSIGDRAAARGHLAEAVELSTQLQGDSHLLCLLYLNAGLLDVVEGRLAEARASLLASFMVANRIGDLEAEAVLIVGMGMHASALGDDDRAASLHGLGVALLEQIGQVITADDVRLVAPDREALRERMGSDAFEAAWMLGVQQSRTWWQKYPESRATLLFGERQPKVDTGPEARTRDDPTSPRLSDRERELLRFLADGLTDKQIAEEMFISIRTVRSHLDRIRDKTGCRRRADLTRLAGQVGIDR